MQKKLLYFITALVIILLGTTVFLTAKKFFTPKKVHYHAGFVIFQNNKKVDFSDSRYMYLEPCTLMSDNMHDDNATIQIKKAHLHDNVGDVVHSEQAGAIWKDLFTNIRFPIDYTQTKGFINGKQVNNFQLQPIQPFDSLVVFIGSNDSKLLSQAVTKDYMINVAKKSTTCGD